MLTAFAVRTLAFAVAWLVLVDGDIYLWWFGLLAALAAAGLSIVLIPPAPRWLSPLALARFVPFFLIQTCIGGVDVGRRALAGAVEPVFFDYPLALRSEPARLTFACLVSLLPGTLTARLDADTATIHVLARDMPAREVLARLEHHVAAIFRDH